MTLLYPHYKTMCFLRASLASPGTSDPWGCWHRTSPPPHRNPGDETRDAPSSQHWLVGGWALPLWKIWVSCDKKKSQHISIWEKNNLFQTTNQLNILLNNRPKIFQPNALQDIAKPHVYFLSDQSSWIFCHCSDRLPKIRPPIVHPKFWVMVALTILIHFESHKSMANRANNRYDVIRWAIINHHSIIMLAGIPAAWSIRSYEIHQSLQRSISSSP